MHQYPFTEYYHVQPYDPGYIIASQGLLKGKVWIKHMLAKPLTIVEGSRGMASGATSWSCAPTTPLQPTPPNLSSFLPPISFTCPP